MGLALLFNADRCCCIKKYDEPTTAVLKVALFIICFVYFQIKLEDPNGVLRETQEQLLTKLREWCNMPIFSARTAVSN